MNNKNLNLIVYLYLLINIQFINIFAYQTQKQTNENNNTDKGLIIGVSISTFEIVLMTIFKKEISSIFFSGKNNDNPKSKQNLNNEQNGNSIKSDNNNGKLTNNPRPPEIPQNKLGSEKKDPINDALSDKNLAKQLELLDAKQKQEMEFNNNLNKKTMDLIKTNNNLKFYKDRCEKATLKEIQTDVQQQYETFINDNKTYNEKEKLESYLDKSDIEIIKINSKQELPETNKKQFVYSVRLEPEYKLKPEPEFKLTVFDYKNNTTSLMEIVEFFELLNTTYINDLKTDKDCQYDIFNNEFYEGDLFSMIKLYAHENPNATILTNDDVAKLKDKMKTCLHSIDYLEICSMFLELFTYDKSKDNTKQQLEKNINIIAKKDEKPVSKNNESIIWHDEFINSWFNILCTWKNHMGIQDKKDDINIQKTSWNEVITKILKPLIESLNHRVDETDLCKTKGRSVTLRKILLWDILNTINNLTLKDLDGIELRLELFKSINNLYPNFKDFVTKIKNSRNFIITEKFFIQEYQNKIEKKDMIEYEKEPFTKQNLDNLLSMIE